MFFIFLQRSAPEIMEDDTFFDTLYEFQSRRMDEQRCSFSKLKGVRREEPPKPAGMWEGCNKKNKNSKNVDWSKVFHTFVVHSQPSRVVGKYISVTCKFYAS